jgi:hypothetical protein
MICTDIEDDLRDLERLISRVVPDKAAPLARWRKRLEVLLEGGRSHAAGAPATGRRHRADQRTPVRNGCEALQRLNR